MQDTTGRINVEIMAMSMCTRPDTDSGDHEKPAENEYPDRHRPVACHDNGQFQRFRDERYRSFASCIRHSGVHAYASRLFGMGGMTGGRSTHGQA